MRRATASFGRRATNGRRSRCRWSMERYRSDRPGLAPNGRRELASQRGNNLSDSDSAVTENKKNHTVRFSPVEGSCIV